MENSLHCTKFKNPKNCPKHWGMINLYKSKIEIDYGIRLDVNEFKNSNKWSDRMKYVFQTQGKPWSDTIEAQVKGKVASCVQMDPKNALNPHKRSSIDALVHSLESMIK